MSAKDEYRQLCKTETTIPIFARDWWLDAACGKDNWDVVLSRKNGEIVASLPYYTTRSLKGEMIHMPQLTHTMGVWIRYPENQKYNRRLSFENEVMTELIDSLPKFDYFSQRFDYTITNWLPFYWRGFQQTSRYTYVCENIRNVDALWGELKQKVRTEIRKARKAGLSVVRETNFDVFWHLISRTFERQGRKPSCTRDYLKSLYSASHSRDAGKIIVAFGKDKSPHAGLFYVWTNNTASFIISGANPRLRNVGATSLIYWEGILDAAEVSERVNFCGSMMPTVEPLLRGFGTRQKPYFVITKDQSNLLWKAARNARNMVRELGYAVWSTRRSS